MPMPPVICPACGRYDQVEKVSTLYLRGAGLGRGRLHSRSGTEAGPDPGWPLTLSPAEFKRLSRQLSPPSGKSSLTRPIHPDIVILFFTAVLPFFLAGVYTTQPGYFLPLVVLVAAGYGLYFLLRRRILLRFQAQLDLRQAEIQRIRNGIETWMQLYYCVRDQGVFLPKDETVTPLDQLSTYLSGPKRL